MPTFSEKSKQHFHRLLLLVWMITASATHSTSASTIDDGPLTDHEITTIIEQYRSPSAIAQMADWKTLVLHPDDNFRKLVLKNLPASYQRFKNHDDKLRSLVDQILTKALSPYDKHYDLVILNHPGPTIINEFYSALTITTGLLQQVPDDDALVMLAFHELGHEFFAEKSTALHKELDALIKAGKESSTEAATIIKQLMFIELQCDAVATRLAISAGYNPGELPKFIERIYKDFPEETTRLQARQINHHPDPAIRRRVIESIAGQEILNRKPQTSTALKAIKSIISLDQPTQTATIN